MYGIYQDVIVQNDRASIFSLLTTAKGLEKWWSNRSIGDLGVGNKMQIYFSPAYDWEMECCSFEKDKSVSWSMTRTMVDWIPTKLIFELITINDSSTMIRFSHEGWTHISAHYRRSSYSWGTILKNFKIIC